MKGTTPLSESALQQHNARRLTSTTNFAENMINQERAQACERATAGRLLGQDILHISPSQLNVTLNRDAETKSGLGSYENLYRVPKPCSMTPRERMMVMSPMNEPFALNGKLGMAGAGVQEAFMETVRARTNAARAVAAGSASSSQSGTSDQANHGSISQS